MITPRVTRLVRVATLQAFREAAALLATQGSPFDARHRLLIVPTRAAGEHLIRGIEDAASSHAVILPDFCTPGEIVRRFADRLFPPRPRLTDEEREVLLRVSCRAVISDGMDAPFRVRPGLVAEMLRFYDDLHRRQKDVDTFERLALGMLEPGAADDRGARQLVHQTRFLAAVFRDFARRCAVEGADDHVLRRDVLAGPLARPYRHVVVTVADRAVDRHGLLPADWDLLARAEGVEQLDLLVTDRRLAGALHERIHSLLPGLEEVRFESNAGICEPVVAVPDDARRVFVARDREEEVRTVARRLKHAVRAGRLGALSRAALVVHQPLPYTYLAQSVFGSAGAPCQLFDTLPLAAEPFSAAFDLVLTFVSSGFARDAGIHLLRTPHFGFANIDAAPVTSWDVAALERAMSERGCSDAEGLDSLLTAASTKTSLLNSRVTRAGQLFRALADDLRPLRTPRPVAEHLSGLLTFLEQHAAPPADDGSSERELRARSAILMTIRALRDAHARFESAPADFDEVAALLRRWIEGQTFAPRTGDAGVHLVDSASAPFGHFELVHLAGLVDGEWPDPPRRNIFYSANILRELGWPSERDRIDGERSAFADLLRSATGEVAVSAFLLEHDAVASPSPFLDEIEHTMVHDVAPAPYLQVFEDEAFCADDVDLQSFSALTREWAAFRRAARRGDDPRFRGQAGAHAAQGYSLSGLERYQDCPFKFFASDVLRLEEPPDDGSALSPRARGRFIHELLQQFFTAWDERGRGNVTPLLMGEARTLFADVAEPRLAQLPASDAALERARLFGSPLSVGVVDLVLALEASRTGAVKERWLEYRLDGEFTLGGDGSRKVALRGVADRIDLLDGNRLRVIDYKTGSAPERSRALQVPIYAVCAQERLTGERGGEWTVDEALYVALPGKRSLVRMVKEGDDEMLVSARERTFALIDRIAAGEFPPQPHDPMICSYCAFPSVCRKDYVE